MLGRLDVPLDPLGERQAAALGTVTQLREAARVVTSPLGRARRTAEALGPPVTVDERWIEVDYGIYDGLELSSVPAELWESWRADLSWVPEGGESLTSVALRVGSALDQLWEEALESDVVVVSHVSPIKAAMAWALGGPDELVWRMFVEVASVSRIAAGPHGPSLRSFNEVHHRPSS